MDADYFVSNELHHSTMQRCVIHTECIHVSCYKSICWPLVRKINIQSTFRIKFWQSLTKVTHGASIRSWDPVTLMDGCVSVCTCVSSHGLCVCPILMLLCAWSQLGTAHIHIAMQPTQHASWGYSGVQCSALVLNIMTILLVEALESPTFFFSRLYYYCYCYNKIIIKLTP